MALFRHDTGTVYHAIANARPSAATGEAIYSRCNTRRRFSTRDFDEAWTISGRIASTPPGASSSPRRRSLLKDHGVFRLRAPPACVLQGALATVHSQPSNHRREPAARAPGPIHSLGATVESLMACRKPARLRGKSELFKSARSSPISFCSTTFGIIANPFSDISFSQRNGPVQLQTSMTHVTVLCFS
jgi:hypothetical protein